MRSEPSDGIGAVLLVLNPSSGRADPDRVVEALQRRVGALAVWSPREGQPIGQPLRDEIAARRPSMVVASGGDGTLSAVATALAGSRLPVGIVPSGTANIFAREVGIPVAIEDACDVIARGHTRSFDALDIAGRRCLCRIGWGVFSSVAHEIHQEDKQHLRSLAYVRTALPHLVEKTLLSLEIEIDGHTFATRGSGVMLTNVSAVGLGALQWGNAVRPDDGVADLFVLHADRLSEKLSVLWNAAAGHAEAAADVSHFVVRHQVRVRSTPPSGIVADGEILPEGDYRVVLKPASIALIVP